MAITLGDDGSFSVNPEPDKVIERYKKLLADSVHESIMLREGLEEALHENQSLQAQVDALTKPTQEAVTPTG